MSMSNGQFILYLLCSGLISGVVFFFLGYYAGRNT